ncbi:hypothetical protein YIM73518_14130 [Thermus brockianus]
MEALWKEIADKLSSFEEEVAKEVLEKAKGVFPTRRAKEAFRALAGRSATPLEEPLLRVATALVEEGLAGSYEEAFGVLGVEAEPTQKDPAPSQAPPPAEAAQAPSPVEASSPAPSPPVEAPSPRQASPQGVPLTGKQPAGAPPPPSRAEKTSRSQDQNEAARDSRWRRAYQEVFGQDPSEDPLLYRERLAHALLFYRPEQGRRRAFEEVREVERRLQESRGRARELLGSEPQVDVGAAYIQLGKLSAQLEDLARRVERLEEAVQKEASRFGGVNAALRLHHQEIRALKALVEGLRTGDGVDWKRLEAAVRAAKAEAIQEAEERIQGATALWRGEVEPRLKALEEWAKRITEAFRRTLEAKERRRGLFGLFGGDR